ncbi:MAG: transporter substrate-binding domain-containing protein [Treponema sp.]|nr:transporter substrate-binding domain-containing protein [Treponema sp.]
MKKNLIAAAAVIALTLGFASCSKKGAGNSGKQTIKIAFAQDEGVCSYVDENDKLTGEEVEVWREIAKRLPEYKIEFIPTSQDDLRVGLQTGNYDGSVGDFFLSRERIEKFEIPREPLDFTWTGMLIRKEFADGVSSLSDLAKKQKDGLKVAPQNSGYGSTYILEVYNEQNPDNKLIFETTSEQTWGSTQNYVGVGRYGATCAQKTDYQTNFVSKDGAYHEYVDQVTWVATQNVGAYTLFRKGIDQKFLDRYVEALKQVKAEGIASELSRKFYGYDAYSGEYADFAD